MYVEEVIPSLMLQKPEQSTLKQCSTQKCRKRTRVEISDDEPDDEVNYTCLFKCW